MLDPVITLLASLCGALLFGASAVNKGRAPEAFAAAVDEYQLLPAASVAFVALALVQLETAVCAALIWPAARPFGAIAGMALLLLYALAMAINLARGRRDLDCGCGVERRTIAGWMITRNVALAALLVIPSLPVTGRAMTATDYATVAGALVVCALLYASLEMLLPRPALRDSAAMEST